MTNTETELIYYEKEKVQDHYVLEMAIYWLGVSEKYQYGIKYGFILIDLHSGRRVLMDNHHPKEPHGHLDEKEYPYHFVNDATLISDFKKLALTHMGVQL